MARGSEHDVVAPTGLFQIEDCLDADGGIALPPGVTLISLIDRNIANVADTTAYRYLDHTSREDGQLIELTWAQLGVRLRAIGAHLQRITSPGDRVAILAPQASTTSPGSSAPSRPGRSRCRCLPPNCPATPNASTRHCATPSPPSC
ncbi:Long-chain-fatty-acid--AMP ligase FadD32 [Mycobacterium talmoniae]|uniref:Long-chain-fatty-acid--AMP ligase FadD32 n=1 Tax=Mycobacterium talmoniae TaxID=1858794 RepID=A0A2S8BP20_9MYCO|nr:Long-chain-fatty-acid--AMP ligase FadD32 [Mycobacterium talmoniae]